MEINIPYGENSIYFDIPDHVYYEVLTSTKITMNPHEDINKMLKDAIEHPINSPKLEEILKPGQTIALLCDDRTRPTPAHMILPILIEKLLMCGIQKKDIIIIIALGSHRHMTKEEIISKVGSDIYLQYSVYNSEFHDESQLTFLGDAPDGSKIYVYSRAMNCDVKIAIGSITPHAVMGWGGGGKIIYPGITGEKTVASFHCMAALTGRMYYGMDESPIRLHVEKWVRLVGLDFIVNTVLSPDLSIYRAVAGHYIDAQRQGVKYAKEVWGAKIKKKADIVIVSSYPIDHDFWQSGKAFACGELALRENKGGTIIHVSPNYEGIGPHKEYGEIIGMDDPRGMLRDIIADKSTQEIDPLAVAVGNDIWNLRQRHHLVMVTDGILRDEVEACKIKYYSSNDIQKALDDAIAMYDNPSIAVITQGGELVIY